ncbi:magnesium transporter CorA family protein [Clostridium cylindrosporum]|uniref:Magnesium transport protein CorA n=1 Tax=Clostridium cylindrosporum DSM 605 TaxID=1121307 RepID=A0A0J8DB80_CLOCY|nr:magnesium transporter CorA family protein [Clostridium cylindrosporum]KMT23092.1 magnesium transport protein CorA [Clostridium cylindrosporum DSM 605]
MKMYALDGECREIKESDIRDDASCFYWINMSYDDKYMLEKYMGVNLYTHDDCISKLEASKVEFYDKYTLLTIVSMNYDAGKLSSENIIVFLNEKFIFTLCKSPVKIIKELENDFISHKNSAFFSTKNSPSKLLYYILDKIILTDYEIIIKLEKIADSLELNIMKNASKQFLNALIHLRHQIHTLRRSVAPLRYIGDDLITNENEIFEVETIRNFKNINSKIDKLMLSLESLVQYTALVRESFETEMANKTNELMKLFTIVAMIFSPLTLVTGIYGMNFKIPEYKWEFGYLYVILLMIGLSVGLFFYFKKKNWM